MSEEKEKRNLPFIQETVKQKRFYQIRAVQRLVWAAVSGGVFALAALAVFAAVWPKVKPEPEPAEVQPVTLPEPKEEEPEEPPVEPENPPVEPEEPPVDPPVDPPENPGYPTELPDPNDPNSPDEITIWEDGVPTTYRKVWDPETEQWVYLPEDEIPLDNGPRTGDSSKTALWALLCAGSLGAAGFLLADSARKKKKN